MWGTLGLFGGGGREEPLDKGGPRQGYLEEILEMLAFLWE